MFYKHWKKIALTLTALFWASCSETTEEGVLYGCPPDGCYDEPESSDSNNEESSSSEKTISSSSETASSSSETSKPESSETANTESSSSETSEAVSSSSELSEESSSISELSGESSSSEVTCVPLDSSVTYFYDDYIADVKKMWSEQAAKRDAAAKIDSIKTTLVETPMCLENLRDELDRFIALYGAPVVIDSAVESCSDGTIRPSEEYAKFLKMKEEWEANLPALEEELKKVYEDKLKELEARINKCLSGEADSNQ